jgi:hypothetical protein
MLRPVRDNDLFYAPKSYPISQGCTLAQGVSGKNWGMNPNKGY